MSISTEELDRLFAKSETANKVDFADMRTSLLMIAGDHYTNKTVQGRYFNRLRTDRSMSSDTKIRLTKNHIGKISDLISNIIVSTAPGVAIKPRHEKEQSHRKCAELNQAVWEDVKDKWEYPDQVLRWADDFVGIGEVWTKVFYNPQAGPLLGYEGLIDPATGQPMVDPMTGDQVPDENKPIFEGRLELEEVFGFNVLTDPNCKDVRKSPYYCHRKMERIDTLKEQFPEHAEKIDKSKDDTFLVFDVQSGYRDSEANETMVKEWFFRPNGKFKNGWYVIQLSSGLVLAEGELPDGEMPLEMERYNYAQTKPRGIACTKRLRPYQLEINRSASKIAEHQITLGDDKLVLVNGSKMSAGASMPGVRSFSVSGQAPVVIGGRAGTQYVEYMVSQITEMYEVADLDDEVAENSGTMDPYTLLYRAASQKKKFNRYIIRFEGFLKRVCRKALKLAKYYYSEATFVASVGSSERINIEEFKGTPESSLNFSVEAQSEDVATKLGRQLSINHVLQYVGGNLPQGAVGKLIAEMPYANVKDAFSDETLDYETATNDLLALDRGQMPQMNPYDKHEYFVARASARTRAPDFMFMPDFIKQNYDLYIQQHMEMIREQKEALQREEAGFIPDGGALVGVDLYVSDPQDPTRPSKRAKIPQYAVEWLIEKLKDQGMFKERVTAVIPEEVLAQNSIEQSIGQMAPEDGLLSMLNNMSIN